MIKEKKDLIYLKEINFVIFNFASCIDHCSFFVCIYSTKISKIVQTDKILNCKL